MTNIGPHLLGRTPSPPDERDFKLGYFMADDDTLLSRAAYHLEQTTVGFKNKSWKTPPPKTHWFKAMALLSQVGKWAAPDGDVIWNLSKQLDQGNTPHCVGFGWVAWSISEPYENIALTDQIAHDLYYEIKILENEPKQENGAYVRTGAKAMQNRSRLQAYAFAKDLKEIRAFLRTKGPVVIGTAWLSDMWATDSKGYIYPTGSDEGGHCYLAIGDLPGEQAILFQNSWGTGWGQNGRFKMKYTDFTKLFSNWGEAVGSLELALN